MLDPDGPAVRLEGLARTLGDFRLGPLDLAIPRGRVTALIGRNGSGKTTLLEVLAGIARADAGRADVLGHDPARNPVAVKRRVAYADARMSFAPWKTVGGALDFLRPFFDDWDDARCERLRQAFGLERTSKVAELSLGQGTALALLPALSRDAPLILLDEPTIGLDAVARRMLFGELLARLGRGDCTVVIASHQLAEQERLADYVLLLDRGRVRLAEDMDRAVERWRRVEVRVASSDPAVLRDRTLLSREGDRALLLLDRERDAPLPADLPVLGEAKLTLEELFVDLVGDGR